MTQVKNKNFKDNEKKSTLKALNLTHTVCLIRACTAKLFPRNR